MTRLMLLRHGIAFCCGFWFGIAMSRTAECERVDNALWFVPFLTASILTLLVFVSSVSYIFGWWH